MNDEHPPSIRKIVARIDADWPPTVDVNPG